MGCDTGEPSAPMPYNSDRTSREKRLAEACEIANQDPELREIEEELDSLTDEIPELWEHAPDD